MIKVAQDTQSRPPLSMWKGVCVGSARGPCLCTLNWGAEKANSAVPENLESE